MRENIGAVQLFLIGFVVAVTLFVLSLPTVQANFAEILGLNSRYSSVKQAKKDPRTVERVKVSRAVDGDTIVLEDGRKIRYLNMDTPETVKENTPIRCFGKEASHANADIVDRREILMVGDKEDTDKYGRELRFVFLLGEDTNRKEQSVNAWLVRKGYARVSIIKPNDTFAQTFRDLEREAKNQSIGVWGNCPKPFEE